MNLDRSIKIKIGGIAEDRLRISLYDTLARSPKIIPRIDLFDGLLDERGKIESEIRRHVYNETK